MVGMNPSEESADSTGLLLRRPVRRGWGLEMVVCGACSPVARGPFGQRRDVSWALASRLVLDWGFLRCHNTIMASFPVKAKKCGRPKGRQHDATIHVRLLSPAVSALARLAAVEKLAVADLVRGSIVSLLNGAAPRMVEVARNGKAAPAARIKAAEMVRWIGTFCLYLGPDGLKLARRKAALEAAAVEGALPE